MANHFPYETLDRALHASSQLLDRIYAGLAQTDRRILQARDGITHSYELLRSQSQPAEPDGLQAREIGLPG